MKLSELSNTALRFITAGAMFLVLAIVVALEIKIPSIHAVRWLSVLIMLGAIFETCKNYKNAESKTFNKHFGTFAAFLLWLVVMLISAYFVGVRPWIMLWLLMIIVGADVGGWLFGLILGGDKMWERISAHKTWSGQIGGIICGTFMSILFFTVIRPYGNDVVFAVFCHFFDVFL